MNKKLIILLFFYLYFDSIYSLSPTVHEIKLDDNKKSIKVSGTVLYLATQTKEEGFIAYTIKLKQSHSSMDGKISSTVSDSLSFNEDSFQKVKEVEYKGDLKQYTFAIQVKEKQYAIAKITDLDDGESIDVEVNFVSNALAVGIIVAIVIVAIIILCLICCVLKKCLC